MALVYHFDFELHQMDVMKTTFLYVDLEEEVYMKQLEGLSSSEIDIWCASLISPYMV